MKNHISPKFGIFLVVFISIIVLIVIFLNVIDIKVSYLEEEELEFDVVDFLSDEVFCDILHNDILVLMEENIFCEENDDCMALLVDFRENNNDCYFYLNNNIDKNIFLEKLLEYKERCDLRGIDCSFSSEVACLDGSCNYINNE